MTEKEIKESFNEILKDELYLSTLTIFNLLIKGKHLKNKTLKKLFNKLVDKEDYTTFDKPAIWRYVLKLNSLE